MHTNSQGQKVSRPANDEERIELILDLTRRIGLLEELMYGALEKRRRNADEIAAQMHPNTGIERLVTQ